MKDIIENNCLIAEFMGVNVGEYTTYEEESPTQYAPGDLKYHESWDWLMPVCHKIALMNCEIENTDILMMPAWEFGSLELCSPIDAVYEAAIESIRRMT